MIIEAKSLEDELRGKIKRNKLITLLIGVASAIFCIVFAILRELTKEITVIESPIGIIPTYTYVTYNAAYSLLAGLGMIVSLTTFVILFAQCILDKVYTVDACGSKIIFYKSFCTALYVDGKKIERSYHYWEAPLADGTKVTVSLSRNALFVHMSFSNGRPSIDL